MIRFLLGFGVPFAAVLVTIGVYYQMDIERGLPLLLMLGVVPYLAGGCAAQLGAVIQQPRVMSRRWGMGSFVAGLGAGLLSMALVVVGLALFDSWAADAPVVGAGSAIGALLVVMVLPRARAGECPGCGYDLRGADVSAGGRCTECGRDLMAG